jgi:predicted Zn-dependent protease
LLGALRAAEAEGGDIRGRQSAVMVISGPPGSPAWQRDVDIRVDDHPAPLDELERLLRLHLAYDALGQADRLGATGDDEGAAAAAAEASRLAPGDTQISVSTAIAMAGVGHLGEARRLLGEASKTNPRWPEFVRRFADSGAQPELVEPARRLLGG